MSIQTGASPAKVIGGTNAQVETSVAGSVVDAVGVWNVGPVVEGDEIIGAVARLVTLLRTNFRASMS